MIKSEKIKTAIATIENVSVRNIMKQFNVINEQTEIKNQDASPNQLILDSVIEVSQVQKGGKIKKINFSICDKWLKPNNVFSVVQKDKEKSDGNLWILFYDSNTWYIRKGLRAPSTVHVKLLSSPIKQK